MNESMNESAATEEQPAMSEKELKKAERRAKREEKKASRKARPVDNRRNLSILCGVCVAVTIGAVGFSAAQYTQANAMMEEVWASTAKVLVPVEDLPAGTVLTSENTRIASVPKTYIPRAAARAQEDVEGLKCITDMTSGVPIDLSAVAGSTSPAGIAASIRDGYVAKMFAMETAPGLSPMLAPGDYVTVSGIDSNGEVIAFNGVRVVALNGSFDPEPGAGYSTVTLELTEQQVDSLLGLSVSLAAEPTSEHLADIETAAELGAPANEEAGENA